MILDKLHRVVRCLFTGLVLIIFQSLPVTGETVVSVFKSGNKTRISKSANYEYLKKALEIEIGLNAKKNKNHFYATPVNIEGYFYLYWREGRVFWILNSKCSDLACWENAIRFPGGGRRLSIDKDVVLTKREIGTSTYLVDKPWVESKIAEAVINGDVFVVKTKKVK